MEMGHYHFVKTLFDRLYNSYQSGTLFNFFIPEQNLLEKGDEKTIEILDEVKRIGNQRASNKGLTTLQDVKTYFLAGRFLRLINGIKHNGVGSSLYSFPEIKVILRFIDKDVADSVSIEMFENYTKNCDAILPSKVSGKRQDYVQLGGEISSTDINEIRRHLKNEMERLKIHKLSQIEGSEQMDKLHQFFKDEDFNKFNFPKGNWHFESQSFADVYQAGYNEDLDKIVQRFEIAEKYFEMVCIYMDLFKQILHTDNRENQKEIQNRLKTILDDIQEINTDYQDIVEKNKSNLGALLDGFYEIQSIQTS